MRTCRRFVFENWPNKLGVDVFEKNPKTGRKARAPQVAEIFTGFPEDDFISVRTLEGNIPILGKKFPKYSPIEILGVSLAVDLEGAVIETMATGIPVEI